MRYAALSQDEVIDPADAHQLDQLLRRHRIDLKHSLGQNFLTDPSLRDAIAEHAGLSPETRCSRWARASEP